MNTIRRSSDRGFADHGWLKSFHTFSFAGYFDANHMGFGPLRVINEDRIAKGSGFGTHGHKDMEIISYVLNGALAHKDSMGNGSTIRPGDVQRMSAGSGVTHSEFNASSEGETHFLQIWIQPSHVGGPSGYEEKHFSAAEKRGQFRLIASSDARNGSVKVQQDVSIYAGLFDGAEKAQLPIAAGRIAYVHLVQGDAVINGQALSSGDALKTVDEPVIDIAQAKAAEILIFDMAPH
jgi:quercetin 2,3-dioxygenase